MKKILVIVIVGILVIVISCLLTNVQIDKYEEVLSGESETFVINIVSTGYKYSYKFGYTTYNKSIGEINYSITSKVQLICNKIEWFDSLEIAHAVSSTNNSNMRNIHIARKIGEFNGAYDYWYIIKSCSKEITINYDENTELIKLELVVNK